VSTGLLLSGVIVFLAGEKDVGFAVTGCVIAAVVFFAYPKVYDDSTLKGIKKTVGDPDNMKVFGRQSVTLSSEGIHVSGTEAETRLAWDHIVKLAETPDYLFLYTSAVAAIIIPRRSLQGASFEEVRIQLRAYTGKMASAA